MLTYIGLARLVKFAKLLLRQPYGLPYKLHVDASFAILALIYDYLAFSFIICLLTITDT